MFNYNLEHIFSYTGTISPPERIGSVAEGRKLNFYVTGGKVEGPKVNGKLLPGGGDWMTLRTDGVGIVDVRATIQTHDNALIYTVYSGMVDMGEDGYENLPKGKVPPVVSIHVAPRYYTSHPDYQWLNRIQCLGIGQSDMRRSEVSYDIYAIRS